MRQMRLNLRGGDKWEWEIMKLYGFETILDI